ncbi:hypothetical protein OKA04_08975 [Luteolibacter flavescens]|uniref:Uncharacterized protein n=1 Tax=Luteolibacter flavescens TaxID=1859460 RepID=A0ABT3FMR2_9BACT|nr:hypothetical protein [Luteolibacter flavescens]MCW1884859.1 hypothetical protein [Luteolibacter flavescens]
MPRLRIALCALPFLLTGTLLANPVSLDPTSGLANGIGIAAVVFALAAEVVVTSTAAILICRGAQRPQVVLAFAVLNALSYTVFIRMLYPITGLVLLIELLIWLVEAGGMVAITRRFSEKPLTPKQALVISAVGNLVSFIIGYGA